MANKHVVSMQAYHKARLDRWCKESNTHASARYGTSARSEYFPTRDVVGQSLDEEATCAHVATVASLRHIESMEGYNDLQMNQPLSTLVDESLPACQALGASLGRMASAANIGIEPAVFVNPSAQSPNLTYTQGQAYYRGYEPPPASAASDDELRARLAQNRNGTRVLGGVDNNNDSGILGRLLVDFFGGSGVALGMQVPEPPRTIAPGDLLLWKPLRPTFPVFVSYPGFVAGLVTHALLFRTASGFGSSSNDALFYAVKKFMPLGPIPNEPFSLGYYAVPAWMTHRMALAVDQLLPAENTVVLDNDRGEQFSIDFVRFRQAVDPRYEVARRTLLLQYPQVLGTMFSTKLLTHVPDDMLPRDMRSATHGVPPVLRTTPAVLVPPPSTSEADM